MKQDAFSFLLTLLIIGMLTFVVGTVRDINKKTSQILSEVNFIGDQLVILNQKIDDNMVVEGPGGIRPSP